MAFEGCGEDVIGVANECGAAVGGSKRRDRRAWSGGRMSNVEGGGNGGGVVVVVVAGMGEVAEGILNGCGLEYGVELVLMESFSFCSSSTE